MLDPTARRTVYDFHDLSDYKYTDIDSVIEELTRLRNEGYTQVDIEANIDGFNGDAYAGFRVTRSRPESDEEYATRMRLTESQRERRRLEYLRLKAEFEAG